ncbi:MAG: hypothetical protein J4O01_08510 [Chloroflexi bacterium]|nr:hypothetical protein [Chloroflexota bacterium]
MNHSKTELLANPRFIPPDLLLKFGYSPINGIEFDSTAQALSFYQGGTPRVDITSFGLAVRNSEGLVVGHTAQVGLGSISGEFQVLGTGQADSEIHVARWSADANPAAIRIGKSRNAAIGSNTIVQNNDVIGRILFMADDGGDLGSNVAYIEAAVDGTPGVNDMPGRLVFKTTADGADDATEALRIDSSQNVSMRNESYLWIGPDSAATGFVDANLTVGLVINGEANDDVFFTIKNSDVSHAMTAQTEADTILTIRKASGTSGGALIQGFKDGDGDPTHALYLRGVLGEAADTTDTSASGAVTQLDARVTDGGTGVTAVANSGNVLAISNNNTTRLLVKGDGTLHATNVTAGAGDLDGVALDDYDDIGLVRAHQAHRSGGIGMAMTKWDEALTANKEDLIRLGVYGSDGSLYNVQRMNDLLGGAIWQQHIAHMGLVEQVDALTSQLAIASKQMAALTA